MIAAETARCPLLCLTGDADAMWPSGPMADALPARRARPDDQHVRFPGAGHLIRLALLPTDAPWSGGIAFGGDRDRLAAAQRLATARVLDFLEHCPARRPTGTVGPSEAVAGARPTGPDRRAFPPREQDGAGHAG